MTSNLPLSSGLSDSTPERVSCFSESDLLGLRSEFNASIKKLENRRRHHAAAGRPGVWTGTREGLVASVIAVTASMIFGGAAGDWFAAGESGWLGQGIRIAIGTLVMASLVSLFGSLLAGRNPIFWGMGMPLLVYGAGSFCAFLSAGAGVATFLFGAPLFCGLAIMAGVMTAYAIDRGR